MSPELNFSRNLKVSLLLGALALAVNTIIRVLSGSADAPLGNVLLFISASALGAAGALTSASVGIIPSAWLNHDHLYLLRTCLLLAITGLVAENFPRIPCFITPLLAWPLLFAPMLFLLNQADPVSSEVLVGDALTDVICALVAGSLLVPPAIWTAVANRARVFSLTALVVHGFTLTTTLAVAVTMGVLEWRLGAQGFRGEYFLLLFVLSVGTAVPALIACQFSTLIARCRSSFVDNQLPARARVNTFSGLASDFWRRKNAENREREDEKSKHVFTHTPGTAVCAISRSGTVLFANREFREMTGLKSNDILGRPLAALQLDPQIRQAILQLSETTLSKGPKTSELKLNNLPDKLRFIRLASQLWTAEGRDEAHETALITLADITDRRTVDNNLLSGQRLSSVGSMIAGVGHAANNMLTAIAGQAGVAQQSRDPQLVAQALQAIVTDSRRAGVLLHQLLEFAEIDRPCTVKAQDLGKALESRLDLLRHVVNETYPLHFENLSGEAPVICDINWIVQAITNLVLNARESYPAGTGGGIWLSLDRECLDESVSDVQPGAGAGDFVRISVKDQGCGMTPEILSAAFEPLYTTHSKGGHMGMGLSTVFAIARAHDGFLSVNSKPEKGTSVSLYLPLAASVDSRAASPAQEPAAAEELFLEPKSFEILVVEDDDNIRGVVSAMLSTLGYKVSSCGDGEAALKKCGCERFDLILVDQVMPSMPGADLVKKIKEGRPETKALLMSGYGAAMGESLHEAGILRKPFDLETLQRKVHETIGTETIEKVESR